MFILPSAQGVAFAAALLAMLVGAINYGTNLGHLLVFLLAGLALVSALHAHRNLLGLTVRTARAAPVFAGEEAVFRIYLESPGGVERPGLALAFRPPGGGRRTRRWREVPVALPGGEDGPLEIPVPTSRRGALALGRLRMVTRYPLGLFRAWAPFELDATCLVYPRPAGPLPLPPVCGAEPVTPAGAEGPGGDDFAGLRDYARGDSPRRIHWKAAARDERGLPVKVFGGGAGEERDLDWALAGGEGTEARLSQLARWLLDAEEDGAPYRLTLPSEAIPAGRGSAHLHRCLAALALHGGGRG